MQCAHQRCECERIDALARRLMQEAGLSEQLSAHYEGEAFEATLNEVDDDGCDDGWDAICEWQVCRYRPDWRLLVALGYERRHGMLRIAWSSAYWPLLEALLAAHGGLSLGQFYTHLPAVMSALMQPALREPNSCALLRLARSTR